MPTDKLGVFIRHLLNGHVTRSNFPLGVSTQLLNDASHKLK